MLHQEMVFLDLETTGGNAAWDRIIEVGICEVAEGELVREWSTLVNPQVTISPFIEDYTGITNAMVRNAPVFAEIRDELLETLHDRLLVAHNARFDYGFLRNEFRRVNVSFQEKVLCTVKLSRRLYPQHRRHNLDALIDRHGLNCERRHRALGDARVLWDFIRILYRDLPSRTIDQAVAALIKNPSVPLHMPAEHLEGLPEGPGFYRFYGENDSLLYVGKSVNLRSRVLSHFSGDHLTAKDMRISQRIRRLDWTETAGELGALLGEAKQVGELMPLHSRRLRGGKTLFSFLLSREGEFAKPLTVPLRDTGAGELERMHGLFRSRNEAEKTLRRLADENELCHKVLGLEKGPGPCFGLQLKKCRGACAGKEPAVLHNARLVQAMVALRLRSWPFKGRIGVRERGPDHERVDIHVIDRWCHLGTAQSEEELADLLESSPEVRFDLDCYKILTRFFEKNRNRLDLVHLP